MSSPGDGVPSSAAGNVPSAAAAASTAAPAPAPAPPASATAGNTCSSFNGRISLTPPGSKKKGGNKKDALSKTVGNDSDSG